MSMGTLVLQASSSYNFFPHVRGDSLIMARIEIYTTQFCGYCYRAKALLKKKGATFTEYDTMEDSGRREEALRRTGGRTSVPQIFINGRHIGGCDELYELDADGRLDPMLAQPAGS